MARRPRASDFEDAVATTVRGLQSGEVVSYGEIAQQAGYPGAARAVGNVLRRVDGLPWWRVVAHDGRLVTPSAERQAELLRAEGVQIRAGRVSGPAH